MFDCTVADALAANRRGGARRILRETELPIASIGYACGYQNNASFTRAFSRHFGIAPRLARRAGVRVTVAVRASAAGSLVEQAAHSIREHIRADSMKVGDTLPGEGWFVAEIGASRAVMREAFGALAALRVIDVGNGRRARVGAIDGSVMGDAIAHAVSTEQVSVAEVWDVRRTLKMRTAELAAVHRAQADADEIARAADAMAAAGDDLIEITRHDIRFQQTIARASGNALFHQVVRSFEPLMTVAVPTAWRTRATAEQQAAIFRQHALIAQAIADRDPEAASSAMSEHFAASIGDMFAVR